MRRLFGVVLLAAVPIACGTVPTAPTDASTDASVSAETFAASARIAPTCSEKADWSSVRGVAVSVVGRGRGTVTVRADLILLSEITPTPCYTTVFSVKPSGRGIVLQSSADARMVTLRAPDGTYSISALVEGPAKPAYSGSVLVQLPDGK
jgi:hypothetical protein